MRLALIVAVVAVGFTPQIPGLAQAPAGPKVQITFETGGTVTLKATDASAREILAEWARLGGSTFVGAERLMGSPMTLEFNRQPERDVIASILRQASGYVIGPRRAGTIGASSFEVVYILATSTATTSGFTPAPPVQYQQQYPTPGAPDDELPPVQGRGAPGPQQAPPPNAPPAPGPGEYRPSTPGVSGVAVPVVPVVPVTTPPPPAGRGAGSSSSGS
jgi:hypothetical protein